MIGGTKFFFYAAFLLLGTLAGAASQNKKTLALLAGNSIHLWGDHENMLICQVIKDGLADTQNLEVKIIDATKPDALDEIGNPDALVIVGEGEANHPLKENPKLLQKLHEKKINIGVFHYAMHFSDEKDYAYLDETIGGHYEPHWSVNPYWDAKFKLNENHPIARGAKPFEIYDEWYFNIRFSKSDEQKITPVILAAPPDKVRTRRFGAHTGNPEVRANLGKEESILWTVQNENGTRGFGFCGGHSVWAFAHDDFRKLLINACAWLAGIEIPPNGIESPKPSYDKLESSITKEKRPDYEDYSNRWKAYFK